MIAIERALRPRSTLFALALLAASARPQCPEWLPGFGAPGVAGHPATVFSQAWFDDGSGDSLFVGGSFFYAGDAVTSNIARWDGADWHAVGAGLDGQVYCLAVFDDGAGPALYAGGNFTASGGTALAHVAK